MLVLKNFKPHCDHRVYCRLNIFRINLIDKVRGSFTKPLGVHISCAGGQSIECLSAMVRNLKLAN